MPQLNHHIPPVLFLVLGLFLLTTATGQVRVSGRVFDISQSNPLEAVSVMSTSGRGTMSDSLGRYSLNVKETDSIWFSYLNKPTPKYAVNTIPNHQNFEIALHVNTTQLKEVRVMPRNYRMDSLQNRQDYARAFDYTKPGFGTSVNPGGGVGLDVNEFINMFRFRRNRRMLAFQERLLREEEEAFIAHRFNRALIIRLTGLRGAQLDTFIRRYSPPLEFVQFSTDYELQEYIKESSYHFRRFERLRSELRIVED